MIRERMQDMNEPEPGRYVSSYYGGPGATVGMSPFLVGAITGAAVALLFAPQPGRDSRRWLADKARQLRHRGHHEEGPGELEFGGSTYPEGRERSTTNPIPGSPSTTTRTG